MSNQVLKLENNLQVGIGTNGFSFDEFSSKFLLKDDAAADHSCGDVKCGASMPF